jgi:hypothetical protein
MSPLWLHAAMFRDVSAMPSVQPKRRRAGAVQNLTAPGSVHGENTAEAFALSTAQPALPPPGKFAVAPPGLIVLNSQCRPGRGRRDDLRRRYFLLP